jgi:pimeloyl-ACP methyl ester carboxylesterase
MTRRGWFLLSFALRFVSGTTSGKVPAMRGSWIGWHCLLAVLAVAGSCCSSETVPGRPGTDAAESGDLTWKPGSFFDHPAEYGTLLVPENRQDPDSRLIQLPVIRIHATGDIKAEPLFLLSGGPGAPNSHTPDVLRQSGYEDYPFPWLFQHNDLIMVGYRGVDGPVALSCPSFKRTLKNLERPLSNHALREFAKALAEDHRRLIENGVDVDGYNIIEVADDLEAVRKSLGFEKINLLSGSYGTLVAYVYCLRHSDSIHRNLMLSADTPGHVAWLRPEILDAVFRRYAKSWNDCPPCQARSPDLLGSIRHALQEMEERGAPDPDKVKIMAYLMLADTASAAVIFDAFVTAENGDIRDLLTLEAAFGGLADGMVWGDFFSKLISSWELQEGPDHEKTMDRPGSILGSPLAELVAGIRHYGGWPMKSIPEEFRQPQFTEVDTLIVGGTMDVSSPIQNVKDRLLPYLRNGKWIELAEFGHNEVMGQVQGEAYRHMVQSYLFDGIIDDSRYVYRPIDFTTAGSLRSLLRGEAKREHR